MKLCEYCNNEVLYKGLCSKHYIQMRKHGKIIRTIYDPNEIIKYDNYAEIIIFNKQCEEKSRAIIDIDQIDNASEYKWSYDGKYVSCRIGRKKLYLHHLIMNNNNKSLVIDHISRNTLDNRKENLRLVTHNQNIFNMSVRDDNTSGYIGIDFYKACNKWRARINFNGKSISLGRFLKKEDAINARLQAEFKYYGEYRSNHNINEKENLS